MVQLLNSLILGGAVCDDDWDEVAEGRFEAQVKKMGVLKKGRKGKVKSGRSQDVGMVGIRGEGIKTCINH